jgi:protein-L-isoaspartate(D-aspartate) O-methyltransferase
MYSCPNCGMDVKKQGLCDECRAEKSVPRARKSSGKSKPKSGKRVLWIGAYVLIGFIGLFLGFLVFGASSAQNAVNTKTDQPAQMENTKNVVVETSVAAPEVISFDITSRTSHPSIEDKSSYISWMLKNTKEKEKFINWRWECAQDIISWKSLSEPRVIEAFLRTPRENFIRTRNVNRAYEHAYMEIGYGATITDPWIVAVMTQAINPKPNMKVLEIGTGSGYQSAFLSELTNYVYTIEIIEALAKETEELYKSYEADYPEYKNVKRTIGDGYYGWEQYAPFDRVIVTCSIDHIPPFLLKQLKPEGIMVIPVGPPSGQKLLKVTKHVEGDMIYFDRENLVPKTVKFIGFLDKEGKSHSTDK